MRPDPLECRMPELPEVEAVRRLMQRALVGQRLMEVEVADDPIVFKKTAPETLQAALTGRTVSEIGRRGKYWWLEFEDHPWLFGHLGMSGWIREIGTENARLIEHGKAPRDDENGRPRFLKLRLTTESGRSVVLTDGRRLARAWLADGYGVDPGTAKLGPDAFDAMPSVEGLTAIFGRRKAPIKALLMDQSLLAGVGNYLADEGLYQAGIAPFRPANTLSPNEWEALRTSLLRIMGHAIEVDADYERFPENWLFHFRWGGARGASEIEGQAIERIEVGGRTTAWVPSRQK